MKTAKIVLLVLISILFEFSAAYPTGLDFDVNKPYGTATVSSLPGEIRETRTDVYDFGTKEHDKTGIHKIPSATTSTLSTESPTAGRLLYNNTTGALLYGSGSSWIGTNGAINVPQAQINSYGDSLTAAVAAIGATPATLVIDREATLSASTTIPATLTLEFIGAGKITLGNFNLTLNDEIRGPPSTIFNYSGAGVVIRGTTGPSSFLVDWFGAVGDSGTNDRAAVVNAITSFGSAQGVVTFWGGKNYLVSGNETTVPSNITLKFLPNGALLLLNHNLIMNGDFFCSGISCFSLTGSGIVKRGTTGRLSVTPENFGGTGISAISAAFSYCDDNPAKVIFTQGNYGVTTSLVAGVNVTLSVLNTASVVVTSPATLTLNGRVESEKRTAPWHSGTGTVIITTTTFSGITGEYKLPYGTYSVPVSTTVPSTCQLKYATGTTIAVATGQTLTLNGPIVEGPRQLFSCAGSGKVVFGPGAVTELYPCWWGDVTGADASPMIQAAFDCAVNSDIYCTIKNSYISYTILSGLSLDANHCTWDLNGSVVGCALTGTDIALTITSAFASVQPYAAVCNGTLVGPDKTGSTVGIKLVGSTTEQVALVNLRNLYITAFGEGILYSTNAFLIHQYDVCIQQCGVGVHADTTATSENNTWHGGQITGCTLAVKSEYVNAVLNFFGTSFDYNSAIVDAVAGAIWFNGCYFESNNYPTLPLLDTPFKVGTNASVKVIGGTIPFVSTLTAAGITHLADVTASATTTNRVGLLLDGVSMLNTLGTANELFTGTGRVVTRNLMLIGTTGHTDNNLLHASYGNLLADGGFELATVADAYIYGDSVAITSRTNGANIDLATDSGQHNSGAKSLKVTVGSETPHTAKFAVLVPVQDYQKFYGCRLYYAKPGTETGTMAIAANFVQMQYIDSSGIPIIGKSQVYWQPTNITFTSAAVGWTVKESGVQSGYTPPAWATHVQIAIDLTACDAGDYYFDDFLITAY
jgi:hypothetical protein